MRGPFELVTQDGVSIPAGRATVALCRCGLSSTKPFCDGSHKAAGFRATSEPDQRDDRTESADPRDDSHGVSRPAQ